VKGARGSLVEKRCGGGERVGLFLCCGKKLVVRKKKKVSLKENTPSLQETPDAKDLLLLFTSFS